MWLRKLSLKGRLVTLTNRSLERLRLRWFDGIKNQVGNRWFQVVPGRTMKGNMKEAYV